MMGRKVWVIAVMITRLQKIYADVGHKITNAVFIIAILVLVSEFASSFGAGICTLLPVMLIGLFAIWKYVPNMEKPGE